MNNDSLNSFRLIDSHCHLNYDYSPKNLETILHEAHANQVEKLITIATDLSSLPQVEKISETYSQVYHTVGIHPHDTHTLSESDLDVIRAAATHKKCCAIGEIGLDYHYENSERKIQLVYLKHQLQIALDLNLPVVIHSRDAEDDLFIALKDYKLKLDNKNSTHIPGVIHCFSGTIDFGEKCLELGFYISFSGILTFKKAEEVQLAAQRFPLNRILIETDAPFLAPIPYRGKKCEPSMVLLTAQKLAEIKKIDIEEVAFTTSANAEKVFNLNQKAPQA